MTYKKQEETVVQHHCLPVDAYLNDIATVLQEHQSLILTAEPGAGKSTRVPLHMLKQSWLKDQKILMLEPRRIAAKSLAYFLAQSLGEQPGEQVGYRIKNESKVGGATRLEIVTEGILTRLLQQDPELQGIGLVIFDEFHERNLQSDLGLMLLKEVMGSLRDDLHCLVMSATIDSKQLSSYLHDTGILHCPGNAHPVAIQYRGKSQDRLPQQVLSATLPFIAEPSIEQSNDIVIRNRDILVFLPGQGEIRRCLELFEERLTRTNLVCLPLYGGLSLEQQQLALDPDKQGRQKVIFATNIAETSLTIDGISVVIDSGLERQMLFDVKSGMSRLETVRISKASATQRSGRAGRLMPGTAVRLWSESQQQQMAEYHLPEVCTSDPAPLLLDLAEWGRCDYQQTDWITPPPKQHYDSALSGLQLLGLLDRQGKLTSNGKRTRNLPLTPRLATLFQLAKTPEEKALACDICGLLSEKDLLAGFHSADFSHRLLALQRPGDYRGKLNQAALHQVRQTAKRLRQVFKLSGDVGKSMSSSERHQTAVRLLFAGFPDLLAKARGQQGKFQLYNGRGAELDVADPLSNEAWLLVLELNAQARSGAIWLAYAIEEPLVEKLIKEKTTTTEQVFWDQKSGTGKLRVRRCYGELILVEKVSTELSREQKQMLLLQQIREQGLSVLNWNKACTAWLQRATWLSQQLPDFPDISQSSVLARLEDWLLPFLSNIETVAQLQKLSVLPLLQATLDWHQQQLLEAEAPEQFVTPSGKTITVNYDSAQGPMVSVQLQELFGLTTSPALANGTVPLRFELLSPARRPIQTTSDLNGFWQSSYHEVAKEMRGRYPKHRWPEEPLLEKAGSSIKRRV